MALPADVIKFLEEAPREPRPARVYRKAHDKLYIVTQRNTVKCQFGNEHHYSQCRFEWGKRYYSKPTKGNTFSVVKILTSCPCSRRENNDQD